MAAPGLLITFRRSGGTLIEPERPIRYLRRHDTHTAARAQFTDTAGVPFALTGMTVRYSAWDFRTQSLIIARQTASLENQTANPGEAYYLYTVPQIAHAFRGFEEWELTYVDATTETFPTGVRLQPVIILEDIDAT